MTATASFDPKDLESKVKAMYRDVAENPRGEFHFEMGRAMAAYSDEVGRGFRAKAATHSN